MERTENIMKNRIGCTYTAFILAGTLLGTGVNAADKDASREPGSDMEEMMKKMEVAGTPGAAHKALEPLVGEWNAEVKTWMAPDAPPTVTRATAKAEWIMGRRFVQEEFNGEFMGKPFRGLSLTGYDNTKQAYNSVWIDDIHTTMFTSEGKAGGDREITLEGTYDCPITGQKDVGMKQVIRVVSRDKHILEMYDLSKGENVKTMEITYTRK
jgi:hypothetical protein